MLAKLNFSYTAGCEHTKRNSRLLRRTAFRKDSWELTSIRVGVGFQEGDSVLDKKLTGVHGTL